MNISQFMQAMQNPQQYVAQQAITAMIKENPQQWDKVQKMFANKNHDQQLSALRNLYKEKNMDLDSIAKQYNIAL